MRGSHAAAAGENGIPLPRFQKAASGRQLTTALFADCIGFCALGHFDLRRLFSLPPAA